MLDQPSDLTWYAYLTLGVVVNAVAVWSTWRWWKARR